jgi:hypothetical protein
MPYEIDQEAVDSPNLKILDINKPPVKSVAYQSFPKMVYLHPKDKSKEHRGKVVQDADELEAALAQGYKLKPHVPVAPVEDLSENFEAEIPELRRGPGRPPEASEAA